MLKNERTDVVKEGGEIIGLSLKLTRLGQYCTL